MNQSQIFGRSCGQNLVYLNKVYFDGQGSSCPIIYDLYTGATGFQTKFVLSGDCGGRCGQSGCSCGSCGSNSSGCGSCGSNSSGCAPCGCGSCGCYSCSFTGCSNFELSCNTQFTITNTCAVITSISPASSSPFAAEDVIVDGYEATSLTYTDGRYVADLSGIMDNISQNPCSAADTRICPPTCAMPECKDMGNGSFFLAYVTGPWNVAMDITVEGFASNEGQRCRFKACFKSVAAAETQENILVPGNNNFALYNLNIPCRSNGVSPYLTFDFDACAILMNPSLSVVTNEAPTCTTLTAALTATMVITPMINLQVVRPALFSLAADEVPMLCDNTGQFSPCDTSQCASGCSDGCSSPYTSCNEAPQNPISVSACQYCGTNGYSF